MSDGAYIEVTQDAFFNSIRHANSRGLDPFPRSLPLLSEWECRRTRAPHGRTYPGYKDPRNPKKYLLHPRVHEAYKSAVAKGWKV